MKRLKLINLLNKWKAVATRNAPLVHLNYPGHGQSSSSRKHVCWHSAAFGFALGQGLGMSEAQDFAQYIIDKEHEIH